MAKTGKGLPRSLQNVDFGDFDIPVTPATTSVVGGVKKSATVAAPRRLPLVKERSLLMPRLRPSSMLLKRSTTNF